MLSAIVSIVGWLINWFRPSHDEELGQLKQRVADLDKQESEARDAKIITQGNADISDDVLDRKLREFTRDK